MQNPLAFFDATSGLGTLVQHIFLKIEPRRPPPFHLAGIWTNLAGGGSFTSSIPLQIGRFQGLPGSRTPSRRSSSFDFGKEWPNWAHGGIDGI